MPLFQIKKGKAIQFSQKDFKNEKELHQLIDKNLLELFNIRYIKDEYITDKHGNIETLGIDESNRPVVIEYKLVKDKNQLIQANRYITWVKKNHDSFELLVNKNLKNIKGIIDFSNPRIICFAKEYSIDDKCLAPKLGAELWKYRYYDNDILQITREEEPEQLIKKREVKLRIENKIGRSRAKSKTIEEHLVNASPALVKLFNEFNKRVLDISTEIEYYTTEREIVYKTSVNFIYLTIQKRKNQLRICLLTKNDKINDPNKLTIKIPRNFNWGNITRMLYIDSKKLSIKYKWKDIIDIVLQSYNITQ